MTYERWAAPAPGAPPRWLSAPDPQLGPDDLLVAVEAAVVGPPEVLALDLWRGLGSGLAPGGAAVGRVVAAGAAAGHRVGERVLVGPARACFECDVCRRGHPAVCPLRLRLGLDADGALASHVVTRARATTGLVGPLEGAAPGPEAALLAREAALAYDMAVRAGVAPGDVAVWFGTGPIAQLGAAVTRALGAATFAPTAEELALPAADGAAAIGARLRAAGSTLPPRVFEVSARTAGRERAAALAGPGATLVLLSASAAGCPEAPPLSAAVLDADVTIVGVAGAHPDLLPELAALVARGELDLTGAAPLRPWAEVPAIVAELRAGATDAVVVARG
jgi:threonine dehydrogenase-like Zn-dependent dehydrogenase